MPKANVVRWRPPQGPTAQLILGEIDSGHGEDDHVVECDGNGRCNFVAPKDPCDRDG